MEVSLELILGDRLEQLELLLLSFELVAVCCNLKTKDTSCRRGLLGPPTDRSDTQGDIEITGIPEFERWCPECTLWICCFVDLRVQCVL